MGVLLSFSGKSSFWDELVNDPILNDLLDKVGTEPVFTPPDQNFNPGKTNCSCGCYFGSHFTHHHWRIFPFTYCSAIYLRSIQARETRQSILIAPDNNLLYSVGEIGENEPKEDLGEHTGVAEALRGESGTTYVQSGNSEHVIAFSPIPTTGWALVFEEPWDAVTNPILNTTQLAPLILVPILLLAIIALWFGIRQIVQPLQALDSRAAELAWGNYHSIEEPLDANL